MAPVGLPLTGMSSGETEPQRRAANGRDSSFLDPTSWFSPQHMLSRIPCSIKDTPHRLGAINPGQARERLGPCPTGLGDTLTQCPGGTGPHQVPGFLLSMTPGDFSKVTHLISHLHGSWHLQGTVLTTHPRCSRPPSGLITNPQTLQALLTQT